MFEKDALTDDRVEIVKLVILKVLNESVFPIRLDVSKLIFVYNVDIVHASVPLPPIFAMFKLLIVDTFMFKKDALTDDRVEMVKLVIFKFCIFRFTKYPL